MSHREVIEKEVNIPTITKTHLVEFTVMQVQEYNNKRLQNDVDNYIEVVDYYFSKDLEE